MNRKASFHVTTIVAIMLGSLLPHSMAAAEQPWNVVYIMVDDLGWTDLGSYGSDFYQTRNIDQLAADGMRFTQNYSACNACSPTRGALMTGIYPARTHLTDWIPGQTPRNSKLLPPQWTQKLEAKYTTIAEALHDGGYATYHVGKWHLGGPGSYPEDHGFDVNIGGSERGSPLSYYFPYGGLANKWQSLLTESLREGQYLTDRFASEAVAIIEQSVDRPFFLYLSFHSVHTPIQGRADLVKKYKNLPVGKRHKHPEYAAMVEAVDDAVGRVRSQLEKMGIADRTLIVFNSDNGGLELENRPFTDNAPLRGGKGQQWEGGIRVPAIVYWPGVTRPGSICHEQIITMDFYPTILEITGIEGNAEHNARVDGLSLVKLFKDPNDTLGRNALYWHYPHYNPLLGIPHSIIRAGDYKLIKYYEDERIELYNLADDLAEQHNLAESHPDIALRLDKQLQAHLLETEAQLPVVNSKYE